MDKLRALFAWLDAHRDRCFEVLRIYLGVGLLAKGWLFAGRPGLLASLLEDGRMQFWPSVLAQCVIVAHLCGGLMLALGMFTRLAALVQIPILAGAVLFVHLREGLFTRSQNLEFSLLTLFLLVLVFAHGSGRWSIDRVLFARKADTGRQVLAGSDARRP